MHVLVCAFVTLISLQVLFFSGVARASTPQLLDHSSFKISEKPSITVHPSRSDYTTSIILYVSNGDEPEPDI